jgi:hypothetical protein
MPKNDPSQFDLYTFLMRLRKEKPTFAAAIESLKLASSKFGLTIEEESIEGEVHFHVTHGSDKATCFQLYPDIDRFYFEM